MTDLIEAPRGMIFVDFWNYVLTMQDLDSTFKTDWSKLPKVITQEMARLIDMPVIYERCYVIGSYDNNSPKDARLYNWAYNKLGRMPGMSVEFFPRQKRHSGPRCTGDEHHEIKECPQCNASMLGTQEKGVDTRIAIEMFNNAYSNKCDMCTLVSADKDFAPAITAIMNKGVKVIHARLGSQGSSLDTLCWGNFDLFNIRDQFSK